MTTSIARAEAFPRPSGASELRSPESVRQRIESWILAHAQLCGGANDGGIAGSVDAEGSALYVYPEIAGYFLQWLAWLHARGFKHRQLARRSAACQRWLSSWIECSSPQTRIHLRPHAPDWRNSAVFFFDLAMVLRGIASATEVGLVGVDKRLVEALVERLATMIGRDGIFLACLPAPPQTLIPDRWSTRRGAFMAKAAAGVLSAARVFPQAGALVEAASRTLSRAARLAVEEPHPEVHALLYGIEGVLASDGSEAGAATMPQIAQSIDSVVCSTMPQGLPAESPSSHGVLRIDAAAQCVRAAILLQARHRSWSADADALWQIVRAMIHHTSSDGSLPFAAGVSLPVRSVWTAMFAEQALTIFAAAPDDPLLREAHRWIV